MLDLLGLDDVALASYRLWLRHEDLTTEDVGLALGLPASIIARARDRLVELSLLVMSRDHPGRLVAVHPEVPLEQLIRQQHDQLIRRQEQLVRARLQVSTLVADYLQGRQPGDSGSEVEHLDSADAVRIKFLELVTRAEREVLVLHTQPGQQLAATPEGTRALLRALERGVTLRSICSRPAHSDDATAAYLRTAAAHGLDLRVVDTAPVDLTTVDRQLGLVLLMPGPNKSAALLLREPALTNLVVMLFDQMWGLADPVGFDGDSLEGADALEGPNTSASGDGPAHRAIDDHDYGSVDPEGREPTDSERVLLRLLSLGAKDEAAARHLGVSVRTVRRMIADLMRRMDARSRFQAGILAAERGWL
ncbi:LuxR C-terminal-related transcriptional regulator [Frankia sp. Cr1]|uniref:LuxR C-terminal-related transcriptional regulator n=1 Tax=Frankia sp. Cr1 TaxID=3073931 RepID=UPI002AD28B9C|nr:LuxR C-terminal-related transcriptional regulator [Frankia sp. Cr1]